MKLQVVVSHGADVLARGVFEEGLTVGRAPGCDIRVDDPIFSRRHARLERHGRAWSIRDLGSVNGLLKDGKPVPEWAINDGDELAVGGYRLTFTLEEPPLALPELPADSPLTALGATFLLPLGPELDQGLRERSSNLRGHLCVEGAPDPTWLVEHDAFVIGAHAAADLRVRGLFVPRVAAVIVRGLGGFSIVNMVGRDRALRVQGVAVPRQARLGGAERIQVGSHTLRFFLGRPPRDVPCIAQTSGARRPT